MQSQVLFIFYFKLLPLKALWDSGWKNMAQSWPTKRKPFRRRPQLLGFYFKTKISDLTGILALFSTSQTTQGQKCLLFVIHVELTTSSQG